MVTHFYKQKPSIPVIEQSERDNLVQFTAEKLKAQSDELLEEFAGLVTTETSKIESMTVKSHRLMRMFERDQATFSKELQGNLQSLHEFQSDFDAIEQNFDEIDELNRKSKLMRDLVKNVMQRYEKVNPKITSELKKQQKRR